MRCVSESELTCACVWQVEHENATFLHDALAATSSRLFADDLHTLLRLRHGVPLHLRSLLDRVHVQDDDDA